MYARKNISLSYTGEGDMGRHLIIIRMLRVGPTLLYAFQLLHNTAVPDTLHQSKDVRTNRLKRYCL